MPNRADRAGAILLATLDEAFERKSWHGANLKGSIRGILAEQAVWRPAPERKCIAEIVVHAAYWKYVVRRQLTGERKGSFALEGSNWFALEAPFDEAAWKRCVKLLSDQHRKLRAAVAALAPTDLPRVVPGGKYPREFLIRGVAAHDLYHTGQIQTLKALRRAADESDA
jgi:hypothetical protein